MSYSSTAVSQISTLVNPNTQNNQIIRIDVNTNAGCPAINASSFTLNMNGTTNLSDIANARLFYTGTSSIFTTDAQLGSTIASPTGSFDINGFSQALKSGTNYFWLAVDVVAGATISNLVDAECSSLIVDGISRTPVPTSPAGSRTITAPIIFSVGSSGETYTTIQAAYNAIPVSPANSYIIELYGDYNSGLETFPIVFGNKSNAYNIIVRPAAGEAGIVCAGSLASQGIWNLDNAQNIIIDGRPGSTGTTNQFIVRNTKSSAPYGTAFLIRNDAHDISFVYMTIEAETTNGASLDGIVTIGLTTGTNGNDNISFAFCTFRDLSVGGSGMLPFAGVYSSGSASKSNDNIVVDNCKFPYGGFPAISFFANTSQSTVTGNHIYCPAGMTISGTPAQGIYINSGSDHVISGNFIGGTAASCGGGQFNISAGTDQVAGIYINASGNNYIMSNQFSNFRYTTTYNLTTYPLVGISLNGTGNYFVGESGKGNLIGSMAGTGNILLTHNGTAGLGFAGINNSSSGTVTVSYNTIAGLTVEGTRAGANSLIINNTAGNMTVNSNTIGGNVAGSISVTSASNLGAVYNNAAQGIVISNNAFKNFSVSSGSGTYNIIVIDNAAGPMTCSNNNFSNISSAYNGKCAIVSHYSGTPTTATINSNTFDNITLSNSGTSSRLFVIEISTASPVTVNGNTIGNTTAGNIQVNGDGDTQIIYKAGTGSFTATNNIIQGLSMTSGAINTGFEGIYSTDGVFTCTGNTIRNITINTTSTLNFGAIFSSNALTGNLISNNLIENISYSNASAAATLNNGIQLKGGGGGDVTKNTIRQLSNASTSVSAKLIGIELFSGSWNIYNNVIQLDNNAATNLMAVYGIEGVSTGTENIHHNTIKIYGNQSAGATNSAAIFRTAAGIYTLRNNLFQNLRTGGTGIHYAEYSTIATGTYSTNFNYLEASDPSKLCNYNGTNYTIAGWNGAPVNAVNSVTGTATLDANGYVTSGGFSGAGTGTNLTAIVPTDKVNITRGIASWMGAYEGANITTGAISPTAYCSGDAISVSFTVGGGGSFNPANNFTAQLSDASGSFASPATLGILSATTTSGTIAGTIPGGTVSGNNYRVRVTGSDPAVTGSINATDITISLGIPAAPTANAATSISCGGFTANWSGVPGTGAYYLDVATDAGFSAFVPGFSNLNVGITLSKTISGLIAGTNYYYRVRASAPCGTSGNSGTIIATTTGTQQTYIVTSTANGTVGDGVSLRWAITQANANCGHDIIKFNLGAGGPFTIDLTTTLPNLTDNYGVTINGWDNSGNDGTPNNINVFNTSATTPLNPSYKVIISDVGVADIPTALILASDNNKIKGICFPNVGLGPPDFNNIAITISGNNNSILGCYFNMKEDGITVGGNKMKVAIKITGMNNMIGDGTAAGTNLISGTFSGYGVYINGSNATGNKVQGNMIGLQSDGSSLIVSSSGQNYGIVIDGLAANNIIGGSLEGEGNVISGAGGCCGASPYGVYFFSTGSGNKLLGNIIGPQSDGLNYVPSNTQRVGVFIFNSNNNIIGGSTASERNIFSGNEWNGVRLDGSSSGNIVKGNYIGLNKNGTNILSVSSQDIGVLITGTSSFNTIGGNEAGDANVISGNDDGISTGKGIRINSSNLSGNTILGNIIGPQSDGLNSLLSNSQFFGIEINGSPNNTIGGNTAASRNIISANETYGVYLTGAGASGNVIKGNYIGIDKNGISFITGSSQNNGVHITLSAANNTIGGSGAGEGNVISGNNDGFNAGVGIYVNSNAAAGNTIIGNTIGPQADGLTYLASNPQGTGISISNSPNNIIGGSTAGERNIISANGDAGVYIGNAGSTGNSVKGNYIGIDKNGTGFITGSTQDFGVYVELSAAGNTIGGTGAGEGNVISGNKNVASDGRGIYFNSSAATGNTVLGNIIGPQADGTSHLTSNGQSTGIEINASPNNTIGGNTSGARNIISANENVGIVIWGASSTGNVVKGNYIGIDKNGTAFITGSTQDFGVSIHTSAASNTIGGNGVGEGNVISGNKDAFSTGKGIWLNSSAAVGNTVLGNIIGPQADGSTYLTSNAQFYGVYLNDGSQNNTIGGNTAFTRNIISANETYGVYITGASSTGNVVKGNYIGASSSLTNITSSSQDYGAYILSSAANNKIGTGLANEENQIAFNTVNGVYLTGAATTGNLISKNPIYTNTGKPIELNYGVNQGNNGKAAPVIISASTSTITGASEPTNIIEVFKNTTGSCFDATTFVGSTTADGTGNWSLAVTLSPCDYVLATATDGSNNTSEFSTCINIPPTTLATSAITPTSICAGAIFSVPYTVPCPFNPGNIFTAQLSDAAGSFATPTAIGTLSSQTSGTINADLSSSITPGAGYRIRVVASSPLVTGTDNGTNLPISVCSRYWINGAGNWNDVSNWSDVTGGSPPGVGGKSVPHKGVYVYLDNNSFTGPGQIITIPAGIWKMKSINFSGYGQSAVIVGQGAMVTGQ